MAVNLYDWIPESLPTSQWAGSFSSHGDATWNVANANSVSPDSNSNPSTFCSPLSDNAVGYHMEGKMIVPHHLTGDDDYFGFVVGYSSADFTNPSAEYYLIDWKKRTQDIRASYNPCGDTNVVAELGLAISKVTGQPVESEFWSHQDIICDAGTSNEANPGAVTELARANTLGSTGWVVGQEYVFDLQVTGSSIKLTIDGTEELFIEDAELDATDRFCLYTFSQDDPTWYDITINRSRNSELGDGGGNSGANGDPHFSTWTEEHFEYHGQCDLVLTKDPNFAEGLGLDVHIRTKLVRYWSYIKNAVIRIGNDVLEIEGSAIDHDSETRYWVNYEYQPELTEFAGFPVKMFSQQGTKVTKNRIEIDLSSKYPGQKIILSTFKEFVKVKFVNSSEESYGNAVGMLGDYKTGKTLARDGVTEIHDFTEFGQEWQVLPTDGKLFHLSSKPQFPELCIEPEDPRGQRKRRLGESAVSIEDAEAACAGLKDELDRKDCIYDIVATQDMDMVGAY